MSAKGRSAFVGARTEKSNSAISAKTTSTKKPNTKDAYNGSNAIAKGKCGYDGCRNKLRVDHDSDAAIIDCDLHHDTHQKGYKYLADTDCQSKYNAVDATFSESFDATHLAFHNDEDYAGVVGSVATLKENFKESSREYGAWNCAAPPQHYVQPWRTPTMLAGFAYAIVEANAKTTKAKNTKPLNTNGSS